MLTKAGRLTTSSDEDWRLTISPSDDDCPANTDNSGNDARGDTSADDSVWAVDVCCAGANTSGRRNDEPADSVDADDMVGCSWANVMVRL